LQDGRNVARRWRKHATLLTPDEFTDSDIANVD
jgi:predicted ATPase